ncbi:MAG: ArsR/SmtB family transcription factor [Candidatus Fimivivens sp.]
MTKIEEKSKEVAEILKMLSNENRLLIICALVDGPLTVTEIMSYVSTVTQSSVSQQLSILKAHNILDYQKKGQNVSYYISDDKILKLVEFLKLTFC